MVIRNQQKWTFSDPDKCAVVKDYLPYRHPGNLTKWLTPDTVELTDVPAPTEKYLKNMGGIKS